MINNQHVQELMDESLNFTSLNLKNRENLKSKIQGMNEYLDSLDEGIEDPMVSSLRDLLVLCDKYNQTDRPSEAHNFTYTTKVCQFQIDMTKEEIKKFLNDEVVGVYGMGYFFPVEGILTSYKYKKECGFDRWEGDHHYGVYINLSDVPSGYRRDFVVPAFNGLFIPKDSPAIKELDRRYQISFFDAR